MIYFDGIIGTGGEGQQFFLLSISKSILNLMIQMIYFYASMGTGAGGRERGDGSLGTTPWERHRGNVTVGMALWEWHCGNCSNFFIICFKKNLHRTIRMIYFDGSMGTGGEGQQFFYYLFQKTFLHLMIQMIYFDGSVGLGAWGRERGNGTVGRCYDSNDYFDRSVGTGAWGREHGKGTRGTAANRMIEMIYFFTLE